MIAQRPVDWAEPPTHVMGVAKVERLFRTAARLDVDKQDLRRYSNFINQKVYDLLLRGEAAAKANGRDNVIAATKTVAQASLGNDSKNVAGQSKIIDDQQCSHCRCDVNRLRAVARRCGVRPTDRRIP